MCVVLPQSGVQVAQLSSFIYASKTAFEFRPAIRVKLFSSRSREILLNLHLISPLKVEGKDQAKPQPTL